jgi:hypothetical protein
MTLRLFEFTENDTEPPTAGGLIILINTHFSETVDVAEDQIRSASVDDPFTALSNTLF